MHRHIARLLGLMILIALAGQGYAAPALTAVHVSAEAGDAVAAQQKALLQGEEKAFFEVLKALDAKRATEIVSKVTPSQRSSLVKSVSVENENSRATRYEADITYVFDEAKIKSLLGEQKGLVSELEGKGMMILPVYVNGDKLLLWEADNYWRTVITRQSLEKGRGQLIVPYGAPNDAMLADIRTVLAGTKEPLMNLARRYGTPNIVIATAQIKDAEGKRVSEVHLRRPGQKPEEEIIFTVAPLSETETSEALLQRTAITTIERVKKAESEFSLFASSESSKLKGRVLRVEFPQMRDWLKIRKQLEGLPGVEFVDIGAISADYAQVTLYYRGEEKPIEQALNLRGLNIRPENQFWTVSLR